MHTHELFAFNIFIESSPGVLKLLTIWWDDPSVVEMLQYGSVVLTLAKPHILTVDIWDARLYECNGNPLQCSHVNMAIAPLDCAMTCYVLS